MPQEKDNPWLLEFQNLVKSFARALIFGIGLVYTMEMWWLGDYIHYVPLLTFFGASFLIDLYLIPVTMRRQKYTFAMIVREATRNKGLSILAAALVLYLLAQITPFQPPYERDVSTILLLSIPIDLGASVSHILNIYPVSGKGEGKSMESKARNPWTFLLTYLGTVSAGVIFVALPIAPTQEVPMLAAEVAFWQKVGIILLSLALAHVISYASGIDHTAPSGNNSGGRAIWPYADTLISYAVSLLAALLLLYFLNQIDFSTPINEVLSLVIVLGLPCSIGGAAGKLAI